MPQVDDAAEGRTEGGSTTAEARVATTVRYIGKVSSRTEQTVNGS